jgi:hypothetical protein
MADRWTDVSAHAAIARFINCRPETNARFRSGEQSGRNIAERVVILADAFNQCR